MVLKDPVYINPKLKGYYLYESLGRNTGSADGKIKLGVQITPTEEAFKNNPGNCIFKKNKRKDGYIFA